VILPVAKALGYFRRLAWFSLCAANVRMTAYEIETSGPAVL